VETASQAIKLNKETGRAKSMSFLLFPACQVGLVFLHHPVVSPGYGRRRPNDKCPADKKSDQQYVRIALKKSNHGKPPLFKAARLVKLYQVFKETTIIG
jgi:hypothetical protein